MSKVIGDGNIVGKDNDGNVVVISGEADICECGTPNCTCSENVITEGGVENMDENTLTAQEVAQIISQNNDAMMAKLSSMLNDAVNTSVTEERTYDIGEGEAWKFNMKRMADEYQHESLESIRRNRSYIDKTLSDASQNDLFKQNVANQALQNAVETANMVSKQAVRHCDIAIDRQWNVDEQAGFVAKVLNSIQDPAMATAMAVAIAEAMLKKQ